MQTDRSCRERVKKISDYARDVGGGCGRECCWWRRWQFMIVMIVAELLAIIVVVAVVRLARAVRVWGLFVCLLSGRQYSGHNYNDKVKERESHQVINEAIKSSRWGDGRSNTIKKIYALQYYNMLYMILWDALLLFFSPP
jgi:hypothetical protein